MVGLTTLTYLGTLDVGKHLFTLMKNRFLFFEFRNVYIFYLLVCVDNTLKRNKIYNRGEQIKIT